MQNQYLIRVNNDYEMLNLNVFVEEAKNESPKEKINYNNLPGITDEKNEEEDFPHFFKGE